MCYCGLMGFSMQIPIHQVGGLEILWHSRGYGLSKVWDTRVLTVVDSRASPDLDLSCHHPRW